MRFSVVAVERLAKIEVDPDRAATMEQEAEAAIETWLDRHFESMVRCHVCGDKGKVDPADDNDLVVVIMPNGGEAMIACEDCLQAFVIATTLGMKPEFSQHMACRLVTEVMTSNRDAMRTMVRGSLATIATLGVASDLLAQERAESSSSIGVTGPVPPLSNGFRDAMMGRKRDD